MIKNNMNWWANKKDADLFELLMSLPSLPYGGMVRISPSESKKAKELFFKNSTPPIFNYSSAKSYDVKKYQRALTEQLLKLKKIKNSETIKNIYHDKLKELETRVNIIDAIQQENDKKVTTLSKKLFNTPHENKDKLQAEFEEMLTHANTFYEHSKPVTTELFITMMEKVLAHYEMTNWDIALFKGSSVKLKHLEKMGTSTVYLPEGRSLSKLRAARLLTHEIEVHALRTMNGRQSPYAILGRGLDHYLLTEEGLAVHFQTKLATKRHEHLPGFWDAWAVALAQDTNFTTTFETLADAKMKLATAKGTSKTEEESWDEAWRLCLRVYRGITNTNTEEVVYSRDHIYRSGALMLESEIEKRGDKIMSTLFVGKIGLHHIDEILKLDLPPARVPEMVSKEIVNSVLKANKH